MKSFRFSKLMFSIIYSMQNLNHNLKTQKVDLMKDHTMDQLLSQTCC